MSAKATDPIVAFEDEKARTIAANSADPEWRRIAQEWMSHAFKTRYMYNFSSLGRPVIQTPIDIVAMQELIWEVKPDLVIETGIAHGGSLVLNASMLALLEYCDAASRGTTLDPRSPRRKVLGIDIDIRSHNRAAIEAHPMANRIQMIQGSSVAPETVAQVRALAADFRRVMVVLDSNHTHEHVLAELEAYAPLTSERSYCVVFDTIVEDLPDDMFPDRPWSRGDNPKTAVWEYLRRLRKEGRMAADGKPLGFEIDRQIEGKLLMTVAPDGYLRRIDAQ